MSSLKYPPKSFVKKYEHIYNDINYHIILGDGGFQTSEKLVINYYKSLSHRPFPILCIIGNHEPIFGIKDLHKLEKDIGFGEKVYVINKEYTFVAYLKRGKVYNIDGFKFLVLGGGLSIDKSTRKKNDKEGNNLTWWKNEYWSLIMYFHILVHIISTKYYLKIKLLI